MGVHSPRGPQMKRVFGKKKKKLAEAAAYAESGQTIGSLETYVRLWVAESCFELLATSEACLTDLVWIVVPLAVAGQVPSAYSECVAVAVVASLRRRWVGGFVEAALMDLTLLCALLVERIYRVEKKRLGNFEREVVATFAPTVCWQTLVFCLVDIIRGRRWSILVCFAAFRSAQRDWTEVWKYQPESPVWRAAIFDDLARAGAALAACGPLLGLSPGRLVHLRLFATAPAAATEALDAWIFMDFVFLMIAVIAGGVALKRSVYPDEEPVAKTISALVHRAYLVIIAAFFIYALRLDRKPQRETARNADFDRRIGILSRRIHEFAFAKDQAKARFRIFHFALVGAAILLVFLRHSSDADTVILPYY